MRVILLNDLRGDITALLKTFQNGICLALTHMPDVAQLNDKTLMQIVAVARSGN